MVIVEKDTPSTNTFTSNTSTANLSTANTSIANLSTANTSTANVSTANTSIANLSTVPTTKSISFIIPHTETQFSQAGPLATSSDDNMNSRLENLMREVASLRQIIQNNNRCGANTSNISTPSIENLLNTSIAPNVPSVSSNDCNISTSSSSLNVPTANNNITSTNMIRNNNVRSQSLINVMSTSNSISIPQTCANQSSSISIPQTHASQSSSIFDLMYSTVPISSTHVNSSVYNNNASANLLPQSSVAGLFPSNSNNLINHGLQYSNHEFLGGNMGMQMINNHQTHHNPINQQARFQEQAQNQLQNHPVLDVNQIAARQTLYRSLPEFDGNPLEWHIFFNCYLEIVRLCRYTPSEIILKLRDCLKGSARAAVHSLLAHPNNLDTIMSTLQFKFGQSEFIIECLINKVREISHVREDKPDTIVEFALRVQNLNATLISLNEVPHLHNPSLIKEMVSKLSSNLQLRWAECKLLHGVNSVPFFSQWINIIARAANSLTTPKLNEYVKSNGNNDNKQHRAYQNVHVETAENSKSGEFKYGCILCRSADHKLAGCLEFKKLDIKKRVMFVQENHLCFGCLRKYHSLNKCRSKKTCGINKCPRKHHKLLHTEDTNPSSVTITECELQEEEVGSVAANNCHNHVSTSNILFRYIPVKLTGPSGIEVETIAFLDDGSNTTIMENTLAQKLGVKGPKRQLILQWTKDHKRYEDNSMIVDVKISGVRSGSIKYNLTNVRTADGLKLPSQSLNLDHQKQIFQHIRDVPATDYSNVQPEILIGLDNDKIILNHETKIGGWMEPLAANTKLGWVIYGQMAETYFLHSHSIQAKTDNLHEIVKAFFTTESFGVKLPDKPLESCEDARCQKILESTTKKIGDRFETGLIWKNDSLKLPESRTMALRRLQFIEKKMKKDENYAAKYNQTIADYVKTGYARKLLQNEIDQTGERDWYLPHFGVINPAKPEKFRMVFDCAAVANGTTLNENLLKGVDLYVPLLQVLFKLREGAIGFTGDIKAMFHQVRIIESDQRSQMFLWRDGNPEIAPETYVMQSMIFGSTSSPCSAQYVKNLNARSYASKFPLAADVIEKNHYVDDFLYSTDTVESAIKLAQEVQYVHAQGGFEICGWTSNSMQFMEAMNPTKFNESIQYKNLDMDNKTERVLGMKWNTKNDCLMFAMDFHRVDKDIVQLIRAPTKREVLRIVMSIFDPLGLLANFVILGKILLQEIWVSKINWDDVISEALHLKWTSWIKNLENARKITIPRCYWSHFSHADNIQLHIFTDASEAAFAAVGYFRISYGNDIRVVLVCAKSKVAPLKQLSIPRLELQGALLGARLSSSIIKSHDVKVNEKFFWTDSRTVHSWICSDHRKYKQFVAHRVSEILETTDEKEWYWISTAQNVADEATKWSSELCFQVGSRWYSGPDFLLKNQSKWPNHTELSTTTEELRTACINFHGRCRKYSFPDVSRFGKWWKIVKTMGYVFHLFKKQSDNETKQSRNLTVDEIQSAENYLYKKAQHEIYFDEITTLEQNETLAKSSSIYQLNPYLDENSILRVNGRLNNAVNMSQNIKNPIILPRHHAITKLIIAHFHLKLKHQYTETVVNELRQHFWIPQIRVAVKMIKNKCLKCKLDKAAPTPPLMGSLPLERLTPNVRPFSFTGVDYFGPIEVINGRRLEKKWICLFTCLTIRSIHMEIVHSEKSDSFIMAFGNFCARRGTPIKLFSDNSTTFHGAERELRKSIEEINFSDVQEEMLRRKITWKFNPPVSPHQGGVWERLVRSVKQVLYASFEKINLRLETLQNYLCEAENIINSRPLTYISIDSPEDFPLTPNHFLLGSANGCAEKGQIYENDVVSKKQWRISQALVNQFWKKWVVSYLPTLTRRSKWFEKVKPIAPGDLVIIVDEKAPRNVWQKGVVEKVFTGRDGQVRSAVVRTSKNFYTRPAVKLAVLDVSKTKE